MLFPFNKKKNKQPRLNDQQERAAKAIANTIIIFQRSCANYMQRKTEQLSVRSKTILLMLFSILAAAYSIYLIVRGFRGKTILSYSVTNIKKPAYVESPGYNKHSHFYGKEEYERIHRYKDYIDSLARSPGKKVYDSIVRVRPGLMDSILLIEKMYQTNTKK